MPQPMEILPFSIRKASISTSGKVCPSVRKIWLHKITSVSTNGKIRLLYFKSITYSRNISNPIITAINACTSEKICFY